MRYLLLPLLVVGALTLRAWADDPPAGIVMEISGDTDPPLAAMGEIPANTSIQLKPGAKLTFLHYARCKLVTVTGGTLTVTRADYRDEGSAPTETDGPCPRVYALTDSGGEGHSAGGLVSRGIAPPPHWSASPDIIFTGARATRVAAASILFEGQPTHAPVELAMAGRRAHEPQGAPPLQPDGHYKLRLTIRDQRDPIDIPFTVTSGLDSLVVLRID
jgi:hypothetical protein